MIKRILIFLFIPSLIIAIFLSISGIHSIPFGDSTMYSWFKVVQGRFEGARIGIPSIPKIPNIPKFTNPSGWFVVLNVLIFLTNFSVQVVNLLIGVINTISAIINFVIDMLEYVFIFIYSLKDLKSILDAHP